MGITTAISWTDHTFNPWWGCTRVSPACGLPVPGHEDEPHGDCYAATLANRYGFQIWGQDAGRRTFSEQHWNEPLAWNRMAQSEDKRKLVFCGSMCDVMEDRRELDGERAKLWPLIEKTPWLIWLLTTKRPQGFHLLPWEWLTNPPANVWALVTVETQKYCWRIDEAMEIPFAVIGVSCEPLLEEIALPPKFLQLGQRAWVIGGGESGGGARPTNAVWARRLRDDSHRHNVPFHWKQWGEWLPPMQEGATLEDRPQALNCSDEPQRVGKKAAGHLLDGREHLEFPEARYA